MIPRTVVRFGAKLWTRVVVLPDVGLSADVRGSIRYRSGDVTMLTSWPFLRMAMFSTHVGFGNWWIR